MPLADHCKSLVYYKIADLYNSFEDFCTALKYYMKVEEFLKRASIITEDKRNHDEIRATFYVKIGQCYSSLENQKEAAQYFNKSKQIYDNLKMTESSQYVDFKLASINHDAQKINQYISFLDERHLLKSYYGYTSYREKMISEAWAGNVDEFERSCVKMVEISLGLHGSNNNVAKSAKESGDILLSLNTITLTTSLIASCIVRKL